MIVNNVFYIGIVKEISDYDKGIIIFTIPEIIDEGKAYGLLREEKPNIGEEVFIVKIDSTNGSLWYYLTISQTNQFTIDFKGNNIVIKDNKIYLQSGNGVVISDTFSENGSTPSDDNIQEVGVLGYRLMSILSMMINVITKLKVITPQGESIAVHPESVIALGNIQQQLYKILYPKLH